MKERVLKGCVAPGLRRTHHSNRTPHLIALPPDALAGYSPPVVVMAIFMVVMVMGVVMVVGVSGWGWLVRRERRDVDY